MRIRIIQIEIETAIKEYIARQFNSNGELSMWIELSATRGAEGFIADIDIARGVQAQPVLVPVKEVVTYRTPAATATAVQASPTKASEPEAPSTVVEKALVEAAQETAKLDEPIEVTMAAGPLGDGHNASSAEPEATNETPSVKAMAVNAATAHSEPAPTTATRSLFKGMVKPKNN